MSDLTWSVVWDLSLEFCHINIFLDYVNLSWMSTLVGFKAQAGHSLNELQFIFLDYVKLSWISTLVGFKARAGHSLNELHR